jgi:hypothetical protein
MKKFFYFAFGFALLLSFAWASFSAHENETDLKKHKDGKNPGLYAGLTLDVHQDLLPGTLPGGRDPNDFHVEGYICSSNGVYPNLLSHIDGIFDQFNYSINKLNPLDPADCWFTFTADYAITLMAGIPYCTVIHLGLLFDIEAENTVIDLTGWWTLDGIPVGSIVPIYFNNGYVPLFGFNIETVAGMGQTARISNGYIDPIQPPTPVPPPGPQPIQTEIVQLDLVAMDKAALPPDWFDQLYHGGMQDFWPWIPGVNGGVPIDPMNPLAFPPDSFFDIYLNQSPAPGLITPAAPITVGNGQILLIRTLRTFTNNAGMPEPNGGLWEWEIHEGGGPMEYQDFGDAPDPTYPTLLANLGASHNIDGITFLGNFVDPEPDGQPDPNALGDDNNNDDEDGVTFNTPLIIGQNAGITVVASVTGFLNAWVDFNIDGDWWDANEQIYTGLLLNPGPTNLQFLVPGGSLPGTTFARFRFSSLQNVLVYGQAPDGEVEDYEVIIQEQSGTDMDFGDAPDPSYPTLLVNDGARHIINGSSLGSFVDPEPDGQQDPNALGDDNNGPVDDEDGVVFLTPIFPGQIASVSVAVFTVGPQQYYLNAWMDFNGNGSWFDPGEQIFAGQPVSSAIYNFSVPIPSSAQPGITFCRFRLSTTQFLGFTGLAQDGEVEDYEVAIEGQSSLDFGDAPDPTYPTLLINDGARHIIAGPLLGTVIDPEPDGQPDPNALGDDNNGPADDEDGVVFTSAVVPGQNATLDVTVSSGVFSQYLNAWFDFDRNGSWADPGEQIFIGQLVSPGLNSLSFIVPANAQPGVSFCRFRLSTTQFLGFTGLAQDGEVEDYEVAIEGQSSLDFGDAPDPTYPTLLINDGARHIIAGPLLGTVIDPEPDGQPDPNALGDDNNGPADDEDGVVFGTPLIPGQLATIYVTVTSPTSTQYLNAWIDYNGNGSWADAGEQICSGTFLPPGNNAFFILVPQNAQAGNTFSRFRLSYTQNLGFTGSAPDGEVEDYRVYIEPANLDFGDAPDPAYPTLLTSDGARHKVYPNICLGSLIDAEYDGLPDPVAQGDDNNNLDDEDGVLFLTSLMPGAQATIQVTASVQGYLNAWIDFDLNGSWAEANNWVFNNLLIPAGVSTQNFIVPPGASLGQTFARFRFSTVTLGGYQGMAPDGEVEDYQVPIGQMIDYGDAPDPPYPTLLVNSGASHIIVPWLFLGQVIDGEADGQPHPQALGDDNNGPVDDEDGVVFTSLLVPGQNANLVVTVTGTIGFLNMWLDVNGNGSWLDAVDQIFAGIPMANGPNNLAFVVPPTTPLGPNFCRFRLSSAPIIPPIGPVGDGEVEDYQVMIVQPQGNTQVDPDPLGQFIQNEISLALVPGTTAGIPNVLLAAYNDQPFPGGPGLGVSTSYDGGTTWNPQQLPYPVDPSGVPFLDAFDPTATSDKQGNLYVGHIATDYNWAVGPASGLYVHKSTDGGITWQLPTTVSYDANAVTNPDPNYRFNDRCQITADTFSLTSPYFNNIYITWIKDRGWNMPTPMGDIYFSTSTDGGLTWSPAVIINAPINDMGNMPVPAVACDGTVYVCWVDYDVINGGLGDIFLDVSTDGGLTWGPDNLIETVLLPPINLNNGTDARAKGAAVIDICPTNSQEIYLSYAADPDGLGPDEADVFFRKSTDGGQTWTPRLRLHNDGGVADQIMPWMDVKPNGIIDIAFYDRQNDPNDLLWDVTLVTSTDRGNSFSLEQFVNASNFPTPNTIVGPWFGEYLGLKADETHVYVCWTSSIFDIQGDIFFNKALNPELEMDFGDAPDPPYPTLLASNGARHIIVPGLCLGQLIDAEPGGQPDPFALGDDNNGLFDDEDGVLFTTPIIPGQSATMIVTVTGNNGYLNAWFDFDANGSWTDPGEQVVVAALMPSGSSTIAFIVPPFTPVGQTFCRFRLSTVPSLGVTGLAPDGEVEDYEIIVQPEENFDFGDAPDLPYPTLLASNGARHLLDGVTWLGALVDAEIDGIPDPLAMGDDNNNLPDEDGITLLSPILPGASAAILATASVQGYLQGWIDFNGNGSWLDPLEQVFTDQLLSPGGNLLVFPVPPNALPGFTFARFRFCAFMGVGVSGPAPNGEVEDYQVHIDIPQINVDIKAFLQGPYDSGTGLMKTLLNSNGYLPLSQPYNSDPTARWYYTGSEQVTSIPNANVVDWILVELRDAPTAAQATGATMIAQQAAFILKNGVIVGLDGTSNLTFYVTVSNNLFAVIWHRNHLGILSANPLTQSGGVYSYDFTDNVSKAYGGANAQKSLGGGVYGMFGGDGKPNQTVDNLDKNDVWRPQSGLAGYRAGDFNMSGQVDNADKVDIWSPNSGRSSQVPL